MYIKTLLNTILLLIILVPFSLGQKAYDKNPWVEYNTYVKDGNYIVNYTFKDHLGNILTIRHTLNKKATDYDIARYGVPNSLFGPYAITPEVIKRRHQIIKNGLFKLEGNTIKPDYEAIINYYAPYTKIIADWMIEYLQKIGKDTRLDRIRLAMAFVQDIPYAIPPDKGPNGKFRNGTIPIPQIIIDGYGDCDSKTLLFVGIMCYLINPKDIRIAGEPGHVYTIIKNDNINISTNGQTISYFELDDGYYLIADTAGPGRLAFGEKGNSHYSSAYIYKINFHPRQ